MTLLIDVSKNNNKQINIIGVPGSGKTTFAINLSKCIQSEKILYLSFGKENTEKVKKVFTDNVNAFSFHGFAKYLMELDFKRVTGSVKMEHIQQSRKNLNLPFLNFKHLEACVILNNIFVREATALKQVDKLFSFSNILLQLSPKEKQKVGTAFCQYWLHLWSHNCTLPITHDMYFKKVSLQGYTLPYSRIIIDETQDLNNAMFNLIDRLEASNPQIQTIYLGDPCQQIFGFRGASKRFSYNLFDYQLNETHRFGPSICHLVNNFMQQQNIPYYTPIYSNKEENYTKIKKTPKKNELLTLIKQGCKLTSISRYSISLWGLLKFLAEHNITYHVIGGIQTSKLQQLKQLYQFFIDGWSDIPIFHGLHYTDYCQKAKNNNAHTTILTCRFIESIGRDNISIFDKIMNGLTSVNSADILLTTVHQAKGLQFKHVLIGDDFNLDNTHHFSKNETHLIYTAITRVIHTLYLPEKII